MRPHFTSPARVLRLAAFLGLSAAFAACSPNRATRSGELVFASARALTDSTRQFNTEEYGHIVENPFLDARANPISTFSIDVDRASYANVRRFIAEGHLPPVDAVRIEEMVNYFPYEYHEPSGEDPFSVTTEVAPAPWRPKHRLVRITLQGKRIETDRLPPSNLVFLLDVSGSMQTPDKLPLVKAAFRLLVEQLRASDRVAIVAYAGSAGLVLPSTAGSEKERILEAIDRLEAGGSTAGGEGIVLAYKIAKEHHLDEGNNRVILATDGDFNVGVSSDGALVRLIEKQREQGTFLTVLGFGTGNLKDSKMEQLADHGNGNYAYVDNLLEAKKVFVQELGATLHTIAKDVKLQVEFNPYRVAAYRLIGYENRLLRREDFNDDKKDAGDMGAGHTVTALYEVLPAGVTSDVVVRGADSLRYQRAPETTLAAEGDELLYVKIRYKEPTGSTSRLLQYAVVDRSTAPSLDFRFASAVAEFGMLLRNSPNKGQASLDALIGRASDALGDDEGGFREEFIELARLVQRKELMVAR